MEKSYEYNIKAHLLFIDRQQAFDSLNMPGMNIAFKNDSDNIVKLITITLSNVTGSQNKSIKG